MGCLNSKPDAQNLLAGDGEQSSEPFSKGKDGVQEDKIELQFKAKRANVFSEGCDVSAKHDFKNVKKTQAQSDAIRKALLDNFIFASLKEEEIMTLINAMEFVNATSGENLITQGQEGDYFYVVDRGTLSILVDGNVVGTLTNGNSFGELALVYNTPRQATIRADNQVALYSLDRESFRYILAHSSADRNAEIQEALSHVPLLRDLTNDQFIKLSDTVEIVTYNAGDTVIKKGQEGNIFYMIKEGAVKVHDAGTNFANQTLRGGDYFGERALLTGEPRSATVVAEGRVVLMALDRIAFTTLLGPLRELIDNNMSVRVLESVKLFAKLTNKQRRTVAELFTAEKHPAGTMIIKEDTKGDKFYIIKSGDLKVTSKGKAIATLTAGSHFGEMALLDGDIRTATVVATTEVEVFSLNRVTFDKGLGGLKNVLREDAEQRLSTSGMAGGGMRQKLDMKLGDLKALAVLGAGTFGRVSLMQHKDTKETYALKAMWKSEIIQNKQQANVMNERDVMMRFDHPLVLKLYTTFKDDRKVYMLLEFIQGGELFSVVHTSKRDGVPEGAAKFYAAGVLLSLEHLHSMDIAYRDMKPENCLIDDKGYPKLVDFGFAKVIKSKSYTLCGTPEYLAPEIVLGRGHGKPVDYWAFGVLVYEMVVGFSPFADLRTNDQTIICRNIVNGKLAFPKNSNPDLKDLVIRLLSRDVANRYGNLKGGFDDIKNHAWFKGMDFEHVTKKTMKAPWMPKIKNATDTSNFDPMGPEEYRDNGPIDHSGWDKNF